MAQAITLLIPLFGTTFGAAAVFLLKNHVKPIVEKSLSGFAAGVMIAASVWSLLIPAMEIAQQQNMTVWMPPVIGFLLGIAGLLSCDLLLQNIRDGKIKSPFGLKLPKSAMLLFAVTLHNIPEGMAVGVAYLGACVGNIGVSMAAAFSLSIGIAIQNIPEGAIISMPLRSEGMSKPKAFFCGFLSGIVEPLAGFLTILCVSHSMPVLPYLLSFAAGAMMYVVITELIPEAQDTGQTIPVTISTAIGFTLMMLLDVALSF